MNNYIDECWLSQEQEAQAEAVPENPAVGVQDMGVHQRQITQTIEQMTDEGTTIECPECKKIQEPSRPLRIGSFRSAKFVEASFSCYLHDGVYLLLAKS